MKIIDAAFVCSLLLLSVIDLRTRLVPNRILIVVAGGVAVMISSEAGIDALATRSAWLVATALPLFVLSLWNSDGMGMGDVKVAALIGLTLGSRGPLAIALAAALGTAFAAGLLVATKHPKVAHLTIPFVPFLSAGTLAAICL